MSHVDPAPLAAPRFRGGLRLWHLSIVIAFVAVAMTDIQAQRIHDRRLLALASGGFALYGLIAAGVWFYSRRYESRIGRVALLIAYCVGMGSFFLFATVCYLTIEYAIVTSHR